MTCEALPFSLQQTKCGKTKPMSADAKKTEIRLTTTVAGAG
jgi:hypothetical protein